jgi:hypothetical protein
VARLLAWLVREGLYTQGYTDDLALLITGKSLTTVSRAHAEGCEHSTAELMQHQGVLLSVLIRWNLSSSPEGRK